MKILVTGGAGFIGTHLTKHFADRGDDLAVFDNLSRRGSVPNLIWLQKNVPGLEFLHGDVRDAAALERAAQGREAIFHLAAQVAVTTSVANPRDDFKINALGTFNVLEAARLSGKNPIVIYSSTNKVYGGMEAAKVAEDPDRYRLADLPQGVAEDWPLDFHSPYGCSKGAGDQYVRDYARIYGLPTVVFRQSAIFGERQFGIEDQGWLAHFVICAALGRPITIYGDGKQVRDMLYIGDLVRAFERAVERIDAVRGRVFNIGGGPAFTLTVWSEAGPMLETLCGRKLDVRYGPWRPGDQRVYISDIRKAERELGWKPEVAPKEGLARLWHWAQENKEQLA
ncbi:MAG: GDP-mannose 4,6-dehydratase [Anaerolineales bacterium]|nr:GDP-mannose 4,6-dehydratase [Anaerolineales bacterium]